MWLSLFLFVYNVCNGVGAIVVGQCCRKRGVTETCTRMLCNPENPPNDFDVYNIFEEKLNCQPHMNAISQCLADGRNHSNCCMSEAKDRDEDACFGMCLGEGVDEISSWEKYQTCLAINLDTMFQCFQRGYSTIPTPPLALHIESKSTYNVVLSWSQPEVNSHLAVSYEVICKDADSGVIEQTITTRNLKATLSNLRSNTKYLVHIVAVTRDGLDRSLPSDTVDFYTSGVAPKVIAYRGTVSIPIDASSATIACRLEITSSIHRSSHFEWMKMNPFMDRYMKIGGDKYSITDYISPQKHPKHFVSALQIKFLKLSDFGTYRCIATNAFGNSTADIQIVQRLLTAAPEIPPEPPFTCCQRLGIRSPCIAVCGTEFGKHAALRAESFINSHCEDEIGKFLTCTTAGVDDGTCCLRKMVPGICLPLCDGTQMNKMDTIPHECAAYTFAIFQCRMENADSRPATVTGLKANLNANGDLIITWNLTPRADMYHVYWKDKHSTVWEQSSILTTAKRIFNDVVKDLDEIVVMASNSFGNAHPVRLIHNGDKWISSNHLHT